MKSNLFKHYKPKYSSIDENYLKCRQRVNLMKASLVGFIRCNGLKGPSASHLILRTHKFEFTILKWEAN